MTDAELVGGVRRPTVSVARVLAEPVDAVWRALTQPEELKRWFPCEVEVEGSRWAVGAPMRFGFPDLDLVLEGAVLEVDEPHRLAYRWGDETLRFELQPVGQGTRLLLDDELPGAFAARNAAGWECCLWRL